NSGDSDVCRVACSSVKLWSKILIGAEVGWSRGYYVSPNMKGTWPIVVGLHTPCMSTPVHETAVLWQHGTHNCQEINLCPLAMGRVSVTSFKINNSSSSKCVLKWPKTLF
ncbi:hypothetical protein J6590_008007, partial [Homalodisca vitripennis]